MIFKEGEGRKKKENHTTEKRSVGQAGDWGRRLWRRES
jgi:hypothetical protein